MQMRWKSTKISGKLEKIPKTYLQNSYKIIKISCTLGQKMKPIEQTANVENDTSTITFTKPKELSAEEIKELEKELKKPLNFNKGFQPQNMKDCEKLWSLNE